MPLDPIYTHLRSIARDDDHYQDLVVMYLAGTNPTPRAREYVHVDPDQFPTHLPEGEATDYSQHWASVDALVQRLPYVYQSALASGCGQTYRRLLALLRGLRVAGYFSLAPPADPALRAYWDYLGSTSGAAATGIPRGVIRGAVRRELRNSNSPYLPVLKLLARTKIPNR